MAVRQRGDIPWAGVEFGAVGHLDVQRALDVVLEVGCLAQFGAANGFTWEDQRQPGCSVSRPISLSPMLSRSTTPKSKLRVSSGVWKLFCWAFSAQSRCFSSGSDRRSDTLLEF